MSKFFPMPNECAYQRPVVFHRFRVVAQAYDEEQAERIADRMSEFAACNIERVWALTNDECTQVIGEAVLERRFVGLKVESLPPDDSLQAQPEGEPTK